jgi:alanyl-tRNA synthetase
MVSTEDKNGECFCYIVCKKDHKINGQVLNCREFAQKIIDKTSGKGGGVQNFAQVVHKVKGVDYTDLLKRL